MVGGYGGGTDYGLILTPDDGSGYWNVANITGGHLTFNRSATIGSTEKMRIDSSGNVDIADGNLVVASGHGIDFSATSDASGMSSELLDDYEEGTWTAVHGGNNMTGNGYYVRVGGLVHFQGVWTSASGSTSTQIITGLPFNSSTSRGHCAFSVGYTTDTGQVGGYTQSNAIYLINSGADSANELAAGQRVIIQGTYSTVE